jgi:hypothetical protein
MMISAVQTPVFEQLSSSSPVISAGGKLPAENSLVLVQVLERLNGSFRLLVDGSVFQAQLPFTPGDQEQFLARVLSVKPLVLQADSFMNPKMITSALLSTLLQKLGIKENAESRQILEILLKRKRPVAKSKFEALAGSVDGKTKLDDIQAALLAGLYFATDQEMVGFRSEAKRLFKDSILTLIDKIFHLVSAGLSASGDAIVRPALYATFIEHSAQQIQSSRKLFDLVHHLSRFAKSRGIYSIDEATVRAKELAVLLTEYLVQKSVYNRFGVYPDFIISEHADGYTLSVFNHSVDNAEGKLALYCDLNKENEAIGFRLRGSLEGKLARLVCFSSEAADVVSGYIQRFKEIMYKNGYDAAVYLQDVTKTGEAISVLPSINCKV